MAGVTGDLIDRIAEQMVREKKIRVDQAKKILEELGTRGKVEPSVVLPYAFA